MPAVARVSERCCLCHSERQRRISAMMRETDDRGRRTDAPTGLFGALVLVVGATGRSPRRSPQDGDGRPGTGSEESQRWRGGFFGHFVPSE